jgi:hypothetical protein
MREALERRDDSVHLVFLPAGGVRYLAGMVVFTALIPPILVVLPLLLVVVVLRAVLDLTWGDQLRFFLGTVGLVALVSMVTGLGYAFTRATTHVRRLEFGPPERPQWMRVVRVVRSKRIPVANLQRVVVTDIEEQPYGADDPEPARPLGVEVEVRTTNGTIASPGRFRFDGATLTDQLRELLAPAGVPVERTTTGPARPRPGVEERARRDGWWGIDQVAAAWGMDPPDASDLAAYFGVEYAWLGYTTTTPSQAYYNPSQVERIREQLADGTAARALAADLLTHLDELARPLSPRAPSGSVAAARFVCVPEVLDRYRSAAERLLAGRRGSASVLPDDVAAYVGYARYSLARAVLGEPLPPPVAPPPSEDGVFWAPPANVPPGEHLDDVVRAALRERPVVRV